MESQVGVHPPSQQDNEEEEEEKINLYFKVIKTVAMKVKKSETVRNVKAMLNEKEGIKECLQEILFTGDPLQDDKRLVDCGVQQNSTLNTFVQSSVPLRLNIKIPSNKKTIGVEAKISDSIQNVKSLISAKEGFHSDNFNLIYTGKTLEDDKTLASLNIQEESTLHMVPRPRYGFPISVKMPSGEMLKIEVNVLQKVCDIRTLVESMVDFSIDDTSLTYEGRQLEHSKALYCYNVTEESVLEMSPQTQTFQIFINSGLGKTIILNVCRMHLVKDVKDKIFHKRGMPAHAQRLVFEGKSLGDDQNLASYNIQKDSTLNLALWTPAFVQRKKLSELGFSKMHLQSCRRISDLKTMIEDVMGVPVKELCLGDGRMLDIHSSLSDYDIKTDTVVVIATETH